MKAFIALFTLVTILVISSCTSPQNNSSDKQKQNTSDSTELVALIKNMLMWDSKTDTAGDFMVIGNDSIYTGIDWIKHKKRMADISGSNFFNQAFLDNYQNIAVHIDKDLKVNPTKYHVGDIPPYEGDEDYWCKCQDTPDTSWGKSVAYLSLKGLTINGDSASFKWSWGDYWGKYWADALYMVKATRENGTWKISYLEEFDLKKFSWK